MKRIFLCLFGALLLAACGPNREKELKTIEEHEQQLSALDVNTQDEELNQLVSLYTRYAQHFPARSFETTLPVKLWARNDKTSICDTQRSLKKARRRNRRADLRGSMHQTQCAINFSYSSLYSFADPDQL